MLTRIAMATASGCAAWCCCAQLARATFVTEYFNNYGESRQALSTVNSPEAPGWAGDWIGDRAVDYKPADNLSIVRPGYDNAGNETSNNDGAAGHGGGFAGNTVVRKIDVNPLLAGQQGMTGTIWVSALVRQFAKGTDVLLHLDYPDGPGNYIALAGSTGIKAPFDGVPEPIMQYANETFTTSEADLPIDATYLLVAKIVMNSSADGADSLEFWVDPPMASEAALGVPVYSRDTVDAFGGEFSGVGISFGVPFPFVAGGRLDALRMSNDADAFDDIRGVGAAEKTPGDTDDDGDVDLEDLNNVRNHFGAAGTPILGDTDGDSDVDLEDLNQVRNHFGATTSASVPEPSAWMICLGALVGATFKLFRPKRSKPSPARP